MKFSKTLGVGSGIVLLLGVGFVVVSALMFLHQLGEEVFEGEAARRFIASKPTLSGQWHKWGLDSPEVWIERVVAVRGSLQHGSRFYAVIDLPQGPDQFLGDAPRRGETRLRDHTASIDVTGAQFQLDPIVGHDGPQVIAVIPRDNKGTIVVHAYGGDGG